MKNLAADSNLAPQTTLETISRLQELCKIHRKFLGRSKSGTGTGISRVKEGRGPGQGLGFLG